jgi:hypothetical protein
MEFKGYSKVSCNISSPRPDNLLEAKRENQMVKLGDANIRFFHTKATINYRHNYIAMLKENESEVTDHDGKADILWKAFKERMGTSENLSMKFNLHDLFGDSLDRKILDN